MKNKEFWKGAVAGALVVTCIGTGAFAGTPELISISATVNKVNAAVNEIKAGLAQQ